MSRDTETWAAQRSSIVGQLVRSLFSTWTPRDANFYTNRDITGPILRFRTLPFSPTARHLEAFPSLCE